MGARIAERMHDARQQRTGDEIGGNEIAEGCRGSHRHAAHQDIGHAFGGTAAGAEITATVARTDCRIPFDDRETGPAGKLDEPQIITLVGGTDDTCRLIAAFHHRVVIDPRLAIVQGVASGAGGHFQHGEALLATLAGIGP